MMKYVLAVLIFGMGTLLFHSCELINPDEDIPAYVYIEPFELVTNSAQGSNSQLITEAWLIVDGQFLGAYSLPALAPVLAEGETDIRLEPGIRQNGIISTPDIYVFYEPVDFNVDLQPNEVDTLKPVTRYQDNVKFATVENFDIDAHIFQLDRDGNSQTKIEITSQDAFEGDGSAIIKLTADNPLIEVASSQIFADLDALSPFVYLEVNYKSDISGIFGLIERENGIDMTSEAVYEVGFNPSDEWNKIYFSLTSLIITSNFDAYRLGFQAVLPFGEDGQLIDEGTIMLDNIKLIHF